jgi:hypothetical protein
MRITRLVAALMLSLSGALGASACIQAPDTSPAPPQPSAAAPAATEVNGDGDIAEAESALGDFSAGGIGGSDFGHLDLGGPLNLGGPTSGEGPLNDRARCEAACWALYLVDAAICRKLPEHQRKACWARAQENQALCIRDCVREYPR